MPEAVIVDAIRTPIGRAMKGSLKTVRADDLAATPIKALIERNPEVNFGETVDVLMGAASGIGEQGYNVGRNALLLAGIDHHVPGCTVNRFCASSLQTIRMAFHAIKAGEGDQYLAAGVEAVSRAGLGAGMPDDAKHPQLNGQNGSLYDVYIPMGLTAENVAERCKVSRQAQDEWAVTSQNRAVDAQESGHFDKEIVGVSAPAHTVTDKEGNEVEVPEQQTDRLAPPNARGEHRRPGDTAVDGAASQQPAGSEIRRYQRRNVGLNTSERARSSGAPNVQERWKRRMVKRKWTHRPDVQERIPSPQKSRGSRSDALIAG